MSQTKEYCLEQLDAVLASFDALKERKPSDAVFGASKENYQKVISMALAAIERLAGTSSAYWRQATAVADREEVSEWSKTQRVVGVIRSLHHDYEKGYVKHISELIHGEVFGDYLEMADTLLEGGYKDASAVIAGSTLEAHLRQVSAKFSIPIEVWLLAVSCGCLSEDRGRPVEGAAPDGKAVGFPTGAWKTW